MNTQYQARNLDTNELGPLRDSMAIAVLDMLAWDRATVDPVGAPKWYADNTNLALLLEYLHENGSTFDQCIQALRKPWNYEAEYLRARDVVAGEVVA